MYGVSLVAASIMLLCHYCLLRYLDLIYTKSIGTLQTMYLNVYSLKPNQYKTVGMY